MEIGFHCYQRVYTKNDEDLIESRRVIRGKKSKITTKNKPVLRKVHSVPLLNPSNLNQLPSLSKSVESGSENKKQAHQDAKRVTKLRSRWDKTPEA